MLGRRQFLLFGAAAAASGMIASPALALPASKRPERRLRLHNLHTGESLNAVYWSEGRYDRRAMAAIDKVLRDHRTDEIHAIDPDVVDLLHALGRKIGLNGDFQIISGFRSPRTNAMLANAGGGVAKNSLHTVGQAIDIRVSGWSAAKLGRAAASLKRGGVGIYRSSNFVHVDTGRVRYW